MSIQCLDESVTFYYNKVKKLTINRPKAVEYDEGR